MPFETVNPTLSLVPADAPYRTAIAWEDPNTNPTMRISDRVVYIGTLTHQPRSLFRQLTADRRTQNEIARRIRALALDINHPDNIGASNESVYRWVIDILETSVRVADEADPDTECFPEAQGHPEPEGIWNQLDRTGVNRMIKLLRRARDAAFGADA